MEVEPFILPIFHPSSLYEPLQAINVNTETRSKVNINKRKEGGATYEQLQYRTK